MIIRLNQIIKTRRKIGNSAYHIKDRNNFTISQMNLKYKTVNLHLNYPSLRLDFFVFPTNIVRIRLLFIQTLFLCLKL